MNDDGLGLLMSALDPPLAVVTAAAAGERAGCLAIHFLAPFTPLRVAQAGHIRPGHDATERHDPEA